MICPDCNGDGRIIIPFPHNPEKCTLTCPRCDGEKEVSDETPKWMEMGEILKTRRIDKRITLRNACILLNMDPTVLSKMERGCMEPDMEIHYGPSVLDRQETN